MIILELEARTHSSMHGMDRAAIERWGGRIKKTSDAGGSLDQFSTHTHFSPDHASSWLFLLQEVVEHAEICTRIARRCVREILQFSCCVSGARTSKRLRAWMPRS